MYLYLYLHLLSLYLYLYLLFLSLSIIVLVCIYSLFLLIVCQFYLYFKDTPVSSILCIFSWFINFKPDFDYSFPIYYSGIWLALVFGVLKVYHLFIHLLIAEHWFLCKHFHYRLSLWKPLPVSLRFWYVVLLFLFNFWNLFLMSFKIFLFHFIKIIKYIWSWYFFYNRSLLLSSLLHTQFYASFLFSLWNKNKEQKERNKSTPQKIQKRKSNRKKTNKAKTKKGRRGGGEEDKSEKEDNKSLKRPTWNEKFTKIQLSLFGVNQVS